MKLLLVSLDAYSIFHTDTKFIFGGAEVETGYHARGLAALGVEPIVVTRDQGVPDHVFEKVRIVPHPTYKGTGYWNKRKTFTGKIAHRLFGDRQPYKTADELYTALAPDATYVMGMLPEALHLARFSKAQSIPFIFRVAHDMDLGDGDLENETRFRKWAGISAAEAREVIAAASVILVQTPRQQELLQRTFNREGVMLFPPIDLTVPTERVEKIYDVLWIGKNNSFKRPEQLVQLANSLPARKFCMVLNKMEPASWEAIVATLPSNVTLIESVPADQIENLFRQSKVFVSTSLHEGFANTFLQAAKNRVPVVSMGSDPNGMLSVHQGGLLPGDDQGRLCAAVETLLSDGAAYARVADGARGFVERFHEKGGIAKQLYEILQAL